MTSSKKASPHLRIEVSAEDAGEVVGSGVASLVAIVVPAALVVAAQIAVRDRIIEARPACR